MKTFTALLFALVAFCLTFSGCGQKTVFNETEDGIIVSESGEEYVHLAFEGELYFLGELDYLGKVKGEKRISSLTDLSRKNGMFAIKDAENDNILIRYLHDNEWRAIYRKASLPACDFSVDNCIRLELVPGVGEAEADSKHVSCGNGITDKTEIASFLSEIRSQQSPKEAGLYDLVRKSDGTLENCYTYAVIYGFFQEEPNLVVEMKITSYNDLAYSVSIGETDYVLPNVWFEKFEAH